MSGNNKQSTANDLADRLMALAASSNVVAQHAGPSFIPGQQPMLPSFAGNQFLAAYMQTPPFMQGQLPLYPTLSHMPPPPQASPWGTGVVASAAQVDALEERLKDLEKTTDTLAVGVETTQKYARNMGTVLGVKQPEMFKISARTIMSAKTKPKKAITMYTPKTPDGQKAYDDLIKEYAAHGLDPTQAILHALDAAEEADNEAMQAKKSAAGASGGAAPAAGASGGAAPSAANDEWQRLVNKNFTINADLLAHAKSVGAVAVSAKKLPPALLKTFQDNRRDYGFGFNETIGDPFTVPDPDDVKAFEDYKRSVGLPAGAWDGLF
jgi:hypothetical protein